MITTLPTSQNWPQKTLCNSVSVPVGDLKRTELVQKTRPLEKSSEVGAETLDTE